MQLIVGLGNPGKEYEYTRHNIGFRIVDFFATQNNFSDFKESKKYKCLISEGKIGNEDIIIIKPQTFMNLSGKSTKAIMSFYKLSPENDLIVVGDDADVEIGKVRVQKGKSSAGHKGVQSIINELNTKEFTRLRIGIDSDNIAYRTLKENGGLENLVLKNFTEEEETILSTVFDLADKQIKGILAEKA
ncbi:MAG: aminoacyl-tRNA hydrolase [Candidatus Pacebacteria bacterium]|nr:aminoacyl-tRNA hydrolase [Candidatus Paceibacterota bacterium]